MNARQAKIGVDILCAGVIVSVTIALARLSWRLLATQGPMVEVDLAGVTLPPALVDIAPIQAFAPFGRDSGANAPPTTLGIELRGIVVADPADASMALIAPTGGTPQALGVGGTIAGATIEAIDVDHVLLRVGNRIEMLAFPKPAATGGAAPAPALPAAAPASAAAAPASLAGLGATPVGNGYRVGETMAPALRQAGLQPGDIIEKINGTPLGDAEKDRQLLATAALAGNVQAEIVRNGQRMTLSMPLR